MTKEHRLRDIAILIISVYFFAQSIFIVLKMWTSLKFNDKVTGMETVLISSVVLFEVMDILYVYKFDEIESDMYTGELFGLETRVKYKYGNKAIFRGYKLIEVGKERQKQRLRMKNLRFSRKNFSKNQDKTVKNEVYQDTGSFGFVKSSTTEFRASSMRNSVKNSRETDNFVDNFQNVDNYVNMNNHISSGYSNQNVGYSSSISTKIFNSRKDSLKGDVLERIEDFFEKNGNLIGSNVDLCGGTPITTISSDNKRHYKEFFHQKSKAIIEEMRSYNLNYSRAGLLLLQGMSGTILLVPIHGFISYMIGAIKSQDLQFALMFYVPFTNSSSPANFAQFIGITIVQTLYVYLFYILSSDIFLVESLISSTLKTEIKLFSNNLEEFEVILCVEKWDEKDSSLSARLKKLKIFEKLGRIAAHHQVIFRKAYIYQKTMAFVSVYFNLVTCAGLCICLFLVEQGDIVSKIRNAAGVFSGGLALACYSQEGQDIEDGFEEMRDALYRMSWLNMPVSLQKSLVILLTRHSIPPKMTGSYGLFVINRTNLSLIMRAAYSYLNVLNHFKRG